MYIISVANVLFRTSTVTIILNLSAPRDFHFLIRINFDHEPFNWLYYLIFSNYLEPALRIFSPSPLRGPSSLTRRPRKPFVELKWTIFISQGFSLFSKVRLCAYCFVLIVLRLATSAFVLLSFPYRLVDFLWCTFPLCAEDRAHRLPKPPFSRLAPGPIPFG